MSQSLPSKVSFVEFTDCAHHRKKKKNKSNLLLTYTKITVITEPNSKQNKKIKIDKFCTEKDKIIELNFKDQLMPTVTTVSNLKKSIEENELYNMIHG
jgi:hypothetical protein